MAIDPRWTSDDIPDLTGRTVLITGANSGLGLASAQVLAARGAQVILAGRNPMKLEQASGSVSGGPRPVLVRLDLSDLSSVRRAAEEVSAAAPKLDVLMNNAGVMAPPLARTADGFESQIGTNHLGHFALTGLLLPLLREARVVTVSSGAHRMGRLDLDDLNYERRRYEAWSAYGQSKLANLLFAAELDRRARGAGWALTSVAAHPGFTATNLQFAGPRIAHNPVGRSLMWATNKVVAQDVRSGVWPQLYAAVGPEVSGGDYFGPTGISELRGHPGLAGRSSQARDASMAAGLWELSQELTGVSFDWS